eukprot:3050264-Alexandrium_andersonii.AAC.1
MALAAMHSAGGPGAGAFMLPPTKASHALTDSQYRIAMALRVHHVVPAAGGTCAHKSADTGRVCGARLDAEGTHAVSCKTGGAVVKRHDGVVGALTHHIEEGGGSVQTGVLMEQVVPYAAAPGSQARMDIVTADALGRRMLIDVTVVSPFTVAAVRAGSTTHPGTAAAIGEREKRAKYSNTTVNPFVLETLGRMGSCASSVIRRIVQGGRDRPLRIAAVMQDVSCTLQRCNANAVIAASA